MGLLIAAYYHKLYYRTMVIAIRKGKQVLSGFCSENVLCRQKAVKYTSKIPLFDGALLHMCYPFRIAAMVKQISVGSELEKSRKNRYAFLKEILPFVILCPKTC